MRRWPSSGGCCSCSAAYCRRPSRLRWAGSSRSCRKAAAWPVRSAWWECVFVLLQVLGPLHTAAGANLGDRTAAWLYDRLTEACVRPPGMGHLEDPKLTADLTVARDFDLGMTGPPLSTSMDFIAERAGRDGRRPRFGHRPVRLRVVGADSPRQARGCRRTGCCARAPSGETAIPTKCAARSAMPTTRSGSPWIRRRARSCASSAW